MKDPSTDDLPNVIDLQLRLIEQKRRAAGSTAGAVCEQYPYPDRATEWCDKCDV